MTMEPKIIKTDTQHRAYLAEVERLATEDPPPGSPEGDRLELFAKLVEDYEKDRYKFARPDPISAIRFRMEEKGLRQRDLAPLVGGKNRVSEILSGRRQLTLQMIRSLSDSLSIPADLLIGESRVPEIEEEDLVAEEVSVPYLVKSGWLPHVVVDGQHRAAALKRYLAPTHGPLYLRRTITYGSSHETNKTNLRLWVSRVRELAAESRKQRGAWRMETFNEDFLLYVARLSWAEDGPRLAQKFLAEKGIALVLWPALPKTRLDGAAMRDTEGAPIIGLTARFDRLDNFWFTLMHELVHAWKHLPQWDIAITDESVEDGHDEDDAKEAEANRLARDIFIPRPLWKRSEAYLYPSVETVRALADKLHISPAIVAGRLRREKTGFGMLSKLVGSRQVRRLFPEVKWEGTK
jgi:HTH-type transcriptional regulator / antitoxin HigA